MPSLIGRLPKAELHVHIEGTLEPELRHGQCGGRGLDQADAVRHIWQCVDDIGVERIDHGVNCLEDGALAARLGRDGIGLTVCPVSNRWVAGGLKARELKTMLDQSLSATVNSDDPAYFGAYLAQNLMAVQEAAGLSGEEIVQLARNAFRIAWISEEERRRYLDDLAACARSSLG